MLWFGLLDSPSLRRNWPDLVAHSKWVIVVARWIEWMRPMRLTMFGMGLEQVLALHIVARVAFVGALHR